jgi:hypothetical protein
MPTNKAPLKASRDFGWIESEEAISKTSIQLRSFALLAFAFMLEMPVV